MMPTARREPPSPRPHGRRGGVLVAILLLTAMAAIALLGLLPHSARGAERRVMDFQRTLARVRRATSRAPVFIYHETQTGEPPTTEYMNARTHLMYIDEPPAKQWQAGDRAYLWFGTGPRCWYTGRVSWHRGTAGENAWNALGGFNMLGRSRRTVRSGRLRAVQRSPNLFPPNTYSWDVTELSFGRSWRADRQFSRMLAASPTSGGAITVQTLSYPRRLPARLRPPRGPYCRSAVAN